jgi:hypothetical protein
LSPEVKLVANLVWFGLVLQQSLEGNLANKFARCNRLEKTKGINKKYFVCG